MNLFYNGKDITEFVVVRSAIVRDMSMGRCDSIDLVFENQDAWFLWNPEKNDQICILEDQYSSGVMFVNSVVPEGNRYRIIATSLPAGTKKINKSFIDKRIKEIMNICAAEDGMLYELYGDDAFIPYCEKYNVGNGAFLYELFEKEGIFLKCINNKYIGLTNNYIINQKVSQTLELMTNQEGVRYRRIEKKYKSVTVYSPYARSTAMDVSVSDGEDITISMPVLNVVQAGRWARGILLNHNMKSEKLVLDTTFNSMTALARVDVIGNTDAVGEWIVKNVEHDLMNKSSRTELVRCIRTIK